jgi:hypothetical protein
VTVRAGSLHELLGGYPGPNHKMPVCCDAMLSKQLGKHSIVKQPAKAKGANLIVEYKVS